MLRCSKIFGIKTNRPYKEWEKYYKEESRQISWVSLVYLPPPLGPRDNSCCTKGICSLSNGKPSGHITHSWLLSFPLHKHREHRGLTCWWLRYTLPLLFLSGHITLSQCLKFECWIDLRLKPDSVTAVSWMNPREIMPVSQIQNL